MQSRELSRWLPWLFGAAILLGLAVAGLTSVVAARTVQQPALPQTYRGTAALITGGTTSSAPGGTRIEARINGEFRGCLLRAGFSISHVNCVGVTAAGQFGLLPFDDPNRVDLLVAGSTEEQGAEVQFFSVTPTTRLASYRPTRRRPFSPVRPPSFT